MGSHAQFVLQGIERFNTREFEQAVDLFHPDIEWRTGLQPLLGTDAARGIGQVLDFWRETTEGFDGFKIEVLEVHEPRPGWVLIHARYHGRGHASGLELDAPVWTIYRVADDKLASVHDYPTREAALAEIGGE